MSVLHLSKLGETGREGLRARLRLQPGIPFILGRGAALRFYVERDGEGRPLALLLELEAMGRRVHLEVDPVRPREFLAPLESSDLYLRAVESNGHRIEAIHLELREQPGAIHATA